MRKCLWGPPLSEPQSFPLLLSLLHFYISVSLPQSLFQCLSPSLPTALPFLPSAVKVVEDSDTLSCPLSNFLKKDEFVLQLSVPTAGRTVKGGDDWISDFCLNFAAFLHLSRWSKCYSIFSTWMCWNALTKFLTLRYFCISESNPISYFEYLSKHCWAQFVSILSGNFPSIYGGHWPGFYSILFF